MSTNQQFNENSLIQNYFQTQIDQSYENQYHSTLIKQNNHMISQRKQDYTRLDQIKSSFQHQQQKTNKLFTNNHDLTIKKKNRKNFLKDKNSFQKQQQTEEYIQNHQVVFQSFEQKQNNLDDDQQICNLLQNTTLNNDDYDQINNFIQIINKCRELQPQADSWKQLIYKRLKSRNYVLEEYLDKGGQACVFGGYFQNKQRKLQCVFKIYQNLADNDSEKEIDMLKTFEKPINIVKIIDSFQVEKSFILVLERCYFSLDKELDRFKQKKLKFKFDKLLKIIFDLLDGLIQLRIYNILHLDIKPSNILYTYEGIYCFTDFGISLNFKKKEGQTVSFTKKYAAPEQIKYKVDDLCFQTDVYCLGKTLQQVINTFKEVNSEDDQKQPRITKLIEHFENIIISQMIQYEKGNRSTCLIIHQQFLECSQDEELKKWFLEEYKQRIHQILNLQTYDENKDVKYFQELKLFYNKLLLKLLKQHDFLSKIANDYSKEELIFNVQLQVIKYFNNIGDCHRELGNSGKSLDCFQASLQIALKQLHVHPHHPIITYITQNIGLLHLEFNNFDLSFKFLSSTLQINQEKFHGDNPEIAISLTNMGFYYLQIQDYEEGLNYFLDSQKILKQIFKEDHNLIAENLKHLGICYLMLSMKKNGFKLILESLEMKKQIFGKSHPETANTLELFGHYLQIFGENDDGIMYIQESIEINKKYYEDDHHVFSQSLHNYGIYHMNKGEYDLSLTYLNRSLESRKKNFQENQNEIAETLNEIGNCYLKKGERENSLNYLFESLKLFQQDLENYSKIADQLYQIAQFYVQSKDYLKGLQYLLESLLIRRKVFKNRSHQVFLNYFDQIGICYNNLGNNSKYKEYLEKMIINQCYKLSSFKLKFEQKNQQNNQI